MNRDRGKANTRGKDRKQQAKLEGKKSDEVRYKRKDGRQDNKKRCVLDRWKRGV